ncbi:hypothetical protein ACLOJK_020136 [Asimina triloba]
MLGHRSILVGNTAIVIIWSLVQQGKLKHDIYQERVASELEDLLERLKQYEKEMEKYHATLAAWEKNREAERRRLLMEEAEVKQKGSTKNTPYLLTELRKSVDIEPGVGRMVSYLNREKKLDSIVGTRPVAPQAPKGLYLYGSVGSVKKYLHSYVGKTMLMDMFYSATDGIVKHRRRFHFHEENTEKDEETCSTVVDKLAAMLQINEHMHKFWKNQVEEKTLQLVVSDWIESLPFDTKVKEWLSAEENYKKEVHMKHILLAVADRFLVDGQDDKGGASILCFDEIQTVDVFAIVALSGILSRLLSTGTILVATSNRAPEDLNQDGMQKDIFLKLVSKLEEHCQNILVGSDIDYRRLIAKRTVEKAHYFWPLDNRALKEFECVWNEVTTKSGGSINSNTIPVMFGRVLEVPESCDGVARFKFDYLCGRPLGAADYMAIARNYHTVFISDIPMMSMRIRDKARRFITLIDELYNHHCCLCCTAAASIDDLFRGTDEGALFDLERACLALRLGCGKRWHLRF